MHIIAVRGELGPPALRPMQESLIGLHGLHTELAEALRHEVVRKAQGCQASVAAAAEPTRLVSADAEHGHVLRGRDASQELRCQLEDATAISAMTRTPAELLTLSVVGETNRAHAHVQEAARRRLRLGLRPCSGAPRQPCCARWRPGCVKESTHLAVALRLPAKAVVDRSEATPLLLVEGDTLIAVKKGPQPLQGRTQRAPGTGTLQRSHDRGLEACARRTKPGRVSCEDLDHPYLPLWRRIQRQIAGALPAWRGQRHALGLRHHWPGQGLCLRRHEEC
mmetsp:Transcript_82170/g.182617  ORF Transcript_82170/g.182617 Transcript_82170/m.182617 type:complete len:279 (-) Transcript_82170:143-979(-)